MMAGPLGFEPRQIVLETTVLPLTPQPYGCGGWDSNPRSLGYEPNDLATGLPRNIWSEEMDSNHRRLSQRIYSPPPLATRESSDIIRSRILHISFLLVHNFYRKNLDASHSQ